MKIPLIIILLLGAVATGVFLGSKYKSGVDKKIPPTIEQPIHKLHTETEMKEFWSRHLKKVFEDELINSKYSVTEINERYKLLTEKIRLRHKQNLQVSLVTNFSKDSESALAGPWIKNGKPTVDLIIPSLMRVHESLIKKHGIMLGEKIFELTAVTAFIHELDHLAFGYMNEQDISLKTLVENECLAWAQTCEYTIRPLVEKCRFKLSESEQTYYSNWINSDRNADNPLWKEFIHKTYAHTRK